MEGANNKKSIVAGLNPNRKIKRNPAVNSELLDKMAQSIHEENLALKYGDEGKNQVEEKNNQQETTQRPVTENAVEKQEVTAVKLDDTKEKSRNEAEEENQQTIQSITRETPNLEDKSVVVESLSQQEKPSSEESGENVNGQNEEELVNKVNKVNKGENKGKGGKKASRGEEVNANSEKTTIGTTKNTLHKIRLASVLIGIEQQQFTADAVDHYIQHLKRTGKLPMIDL